MTLLIIGLVVFLGVHSIAIFAPAGRDALAAKMGPLVWKALYGIVALIGLLLIIKGYAAARMSPVVVWQPPAFTAHITALLMLPVFVFFLATYFPGRISAALKHPTLVAVKLWALAHLLANGMLADILLFGGFLAWAVADRISLKRREPRAHPQLPKTGANDIVAVVGGLALYAAFAFWAHLAWIGVSPFR